MLAVSALSLALHRSSTISQGLLRSAATYASKSTTTMPRPSKGKKWVLVKNFEGFPKKSDMRLEEFDIPALKDGEFLMEAEYLSVDPYMRPFMGNFKPPVLMIGQQVAKVVESRNTKYPVGTWVLPHCGWTTHAVSDGKELVHGVPHWGTDIIKLPALPEGVPRSYALGAIGMPGIAAYMGLLDICTPKENDTILVSGAAGAVGSVVGQIAKSRVKGCRVIGSAGSEEKLKYLKTLGYDEVFNYKTCNLSETLKKLAPKGIDVYFDNVGGKFSTTVLFEHMNSYGRIVNCGSISAYNAKDTEMMPSVFVKMNASELKMQGFIVYSHIPKWTGVISSLAKDVKEGKIKVKEHLTGGFDKMFDAFAELFTGANLGKAVVKV